MQLPQSIGVFSQEGSATMNRISGRVVSAILAFAFLAGCAAPGGTRSAASSAASGQQTPSSASSSPAIIIGGVSSAAVSAASEAGASSGAAASAASEAGASSGAETSAPAGTDSAAGTDSSAAAAAPGGTSSQSAAAPEPSAPAEPTAPAASASPEEKKAIEEITTEATPVESAQTQHEAEVVTNAVPVVTNTQRPSASGSRRESNAKAEIDYSNTSDGYVMVRYTASTSQRLKVRVAGPTTTYTYNITAGSSWTTFPLSDGNGGYKVTVYENVSGSSYSTVLSVSFSASLDDEFGPFLLPNQYVNYAAAPNTVARAAQLTAGMSDPLEKVKAVYSYVVSSISYDQAKADSVQSGYLVDMDSILASGTGICFDYAAIMAGMLRSQSVPTKLVIGYAGTVYHAWISVYTSDQGWVDAAIYFDGTSWRLMDPTFASSANRSAAIYQYITNSSNYTAKYFY